jgi:mRNA interferase MazF
LNIDPTSIKRGEVWFVKLDPARGAEMRKTRPAVVISSDSAGRLPLKLIAPMTEWKDAFASNQWLVRVDPDGQNGLTKISAVDVLQIRGMDVHRFASKIGSMSNDNMKRLGGTIRMTLELP